MTDSSGIPRLAWIALLLGLAACFTGIFDRDLWTPDEPRDAAVSLRMSRSGDVLIPHLADTPFVEKPPLYFAAAAGSARALGALVGVTGAIRLTSALWGVGILAMTFLLARRLADRRRAILATALLATMAGFVEASHWIRVDVALCFFVVAAAWSFAEVYVADRPWFCLPAGLFTSGAFLTKGPIGPALIAAAWAGMAAVWVSRQRKEGRGFHLYPGAHLLALAAFVLPSAAWMIGLRVVGGHDLWNEWFWVNQAGRMSGTTPELGHLTRGRPLFYVQAAALYTLPWIAGVLLWIGSACRDVWNRRDLAPAHIVLLTWTLLTIVLLTSSVTKREIYLAPVLPAFAMMCADAFHAGFPRGTRIFFSCWMWLATAVLAVCALLPLLARFLPPSVPPEVAAFLHAFSVRSILCGAGFAACLLLVLRRPGPQDIFRAVAITAILYVGVFAVAGEAVDRAKSMKDRIRSFAAQIPPERRPHIAGWKLSETLRGSLDYYCDWPIPQLQDRQRLTAVLAGKDPRFDSLIVDEERAASDVRDVPHRVIAKGYAGSSGRRRGMSWVEGPKPGDDAGHTEGTGER